MREMLALTRILFSFSLTAGRRHDELVTPYEIVALLAVGVLVLPVVGGNATAGIDEFVQSTKNS